ncbi:HelD family protein [Kineococcus radiotolerans]|uniref:ATP-dependent DNA helicase n=1 Tax=Kineococcus radiotolerans (strain ATCC BAA-149 / DSM 14245 / SRS30216) TaxID=266940 RepID=A6W4B6_KINRD|nr:AAA family ATPase [Kineococcus radiotolerans]ABS01655.1 ATP-dependent DNA helicase [Kineococcus radiotolerans SRS30216 = ATCC BAA-149]
MSDPDGVLAAEQRHLDRARAELTRMREHTLSLVPDGGDALADEALAHALHRRAAGLLDDPSTTLFFGRTDHDDGQRHHIGRRHVTDAAGDPVVLDWRADVARGFYRATRDDRGGVRLRRRFGVEEGRLTAYEDEHLVERDDSGVEESGVSAILAREIERPRSGPMRDIVATIQPEQDALVRADAQTTVCVQGAPGTGKTAVGLHRAAWLLYAHRERLTRQGVLVIGPNRAFLSHISAVLPALGEVEVEQRTVTELVTVAAEGRKEVRVRGEEPAAVATLKGDERMAEVVRRAVWAAVGDPAQVLEGGALVLTRGTRRWRVPGYLVRDLLDELTTRGIRYEAARALLPQRLAHAVLQLFEAAGDSPDDVVQDAVARSAEVRAAVKALVPAQDAAKVLWRLLSDREFLERSSRDLLTGAERELLLWPRPPRTAGTARWTEADGALLDEISDQLQRTRSRAHVVLDEAQDLSAMQLRAVGRRCSTGAATVLGDIAQGTTPWSARSWDDVLVHLGKPDGDLEVLDRGFRVPSAVIDYAARLLPRIAPDLGVPTSVREDPGHLDVVRVGDPLARAAAVAAELLGEEGSVGVVVAAGSVDAAAAALTAAGTGFSRLDALAEGEVQQRVSLVPAGLVKGLEFDRVVVVEPADVVDAEPDERTGLRRLYVCLTRAVTAMVVLHARDLPAELR